MSGRSAEILRVLDAGCERVGQVREYAPTDAPNTHWRNWPDGGSL